MNVESASRVLAALRVPALLLLALPLAACSDEEEFARSCGGEAVPNCLPFEASIIQSASVEPDGLSPDDISQTARVRFEFDLCDRNPRPHEISVRLRPERGEAQLVDVLTLRDDGMAQGDELAGDGIIDVEITNPFLGALIPENEDVFLRFQVRSIPDCTGGTCRGGTCVSEPFEIPYRTGRRN